MKKFLILLGLLTIALAGHIYVEQPQIMWQNKGHFSALILRFALENQIKSTDFVKVVLDTTTYGTCSAAITDLTGATCDYEDVDSRRAYYVGNVALDANKWYTLTLTLSAGSSADPGIRAFPIQLFTTSHKVAGSTDLQIVYDENKSCGQFVLEAEPLTTLKLQVSHNPDDNTKVPKDKDSKVNQALNFAYDVYIDVSPSADYFNGAYIKLLITNPTIFSFSGTCTSVTHTCAYGAAVSCVNTTKTAGSCTFKASEIILDYQEQMLKGKWFRIQTQVKNPVQYNGASDTTIQAFLYSREKNIYKYFEKKTDLAQMFAVDQVSVTDKGIVFFWGLAAALVDTTWGCPIGLFKTNSGGLIIWNKVKIVFQSAAISDATVTDSYYYMKVAANQCKAIPESSINTDITTAITGKTVTCTADVSAQATSFVKCDYLSNVPSTVKYVAFSCYIDNALAATQADNFGKVEFYYSVGNVLQTKTSTGTSQVFILNDELNTGLSVDNFFKAATVGQNQVFDVTLAEDGSDYAAQAKKLYTSGDALARSAIKHPGTAEIELLFVIAPSDDQLCCKAKTGKCTEVVVSCDTKPTASPPASVLMRMIANPNALAIGVDSTSFKMNNGIKRYYASGFLQQDVTLAKACLGTTTGKQTCGNYFLAADIGKVYALDKQGSATDDGTSSSATVHWWNAWQKVAGEDAKYTADYVHLAYSCVTLLKVGIKVSADGDATNCVTSKAPATTPIIPGFSIPKLKFDSNFLANPLYPNKYELDFILCFRYIDQTSGAMTTDVLNTKNPFAIKTATNAGTEGKLASVGVLQSQVFNGGLKKTTKLKITNVNQGFSAVADTTTTNVGLILPTLTRVGGIIQSDDLGDATTIALFLDQTAILKDTTAYESGSAEKCWSATDTSTISCRHFKTTNLAQPNYYYSPAMQRVIINSKPIAATEFNIYALININFQFQGMNLGLVKPDGLNYQMVKHFKIFGHIFQKDPILKYWGDPSTDGIYGSITAKKAIQGSTKLALQAYLDAATTEKLGGCADITEATPVKNQFMETSALVKIYGGYTTTGVTIDTTISSCNGKDSSNTNVMNEFESGYMADIADGDEATTSDRNKAPNWGTHFQISSAEALFWDGATLTWGATSDKLNLCTTISWKKSSGDTRQKYGIVCPADNSAAATWIATSTKAILTLSSFKVPFYIGANTDTKKSFLNTLAFVWTGKRGLVTTYNSQYSESHAMGETNYGDACTADNIVMDAKIGVLIKVTEKIGNKQKLTLDAIDKTIKIVNTAIAGSTTTQSLNCYGLYGANEFDQCTINSGITEITLQKTITGTNTVSVSGDLVVNFYVKTATAPLEAAGVLYKPTIQFNNKAFASGGAVQSINKCVETGKWFANDKTYDVAVTGVTLEAKSLQSATNKFLEGTQGSFVVSWTLNKDLLSFTYFDVTLDFIGSAQQSVQGINTKCNMMSSATSSTFDYNFLTLKDGTLTNVLVKPKTGAKNLITVANGGSFYLKCKGVLSPASTQTISASSHLSVKYMGTEQAAIGYDFNFKSGTTDPADRPTPLETIDAKAPWSLSTSEYTVSIDATNGLVKEWTDQGTEATYTFKLFVTKAKSNQIRAGVYIIAEFQRDIAPKLNAFGKLYCEMGFNNTFTATYCDFDNDRRIKLLTNQAMSLTTYIADGYQFKIYGVAQPVSFVYSKIYFAIQDGGATQFQTFITDQAPTTTSLTSISLLGYSVSTNWTRTTGAFSLELSLPKELFAADGVEAYVQFPGIYDDAFQFKGFTLSPTACTLNKRKPDDWKTFDQTNFLLNCSYVKGRRVKMFLKADAANTGTWAYKLTINGVPTPYLPLNNIQDTSYMGWSYPVFYVNTATKKTVARSTLPGTFNATNVAFYDNSKLNYLVWEKPMVTAKIGVFDANAFGNLLPGAGKTKFLEAITLTTTATSAFTFDKTTFDITSGLPSLLFKFAPKSSTKPGLAFIEFTTATAGYAPITPLKVIVSPDKCTVSNSEDYTFPFGDGTASLPYIIDFNNCQPESDISLKITAASDKAFDNNFTSYPSANFTVDGQGSKIYPVKAGASNQQVSFSIKSLKATVSEKSGIGYLYFEFTTSTNMNSYAIQNTKKSVTSKKPDPIGAKLVSFTVVAPPAADQAAAKLTYATITYKCDKPATFYYVLSTDNATLQGLTYSTIQQKTLGAGIDKTWPTMDDNKFTIYGYFIDRAGGSDVTVKVERLKAGGYYKAWGVCVTAANVVNTTAGGLSSGYAKAWNQTLNGGQNAVVGLTYSTALTDAQVASSCSAFSQAMGFPCNRTVCPDSKLACPSSSSQQPSTTTNTTNSTLKRRRQLQTLNCSTIVNCSTCLSNTTCKACSSGYVSVDQKSCVAACGTNQEIVSGACKTIDSTVTLFYTAMPDLFAGADTTQKECEDVKNNVTGKGDLFKQLFNKNANLQGVTFQAFSVLTTSLNGATPVYTAPTLTSDFSGWTDNTVFFKATINGTAGFVYYGLAEGSPSAPSVTELKTKTLSNGTLVQGFAVFKQKGESFNQTIRSLKSCQDYSGFSAAQSVFPDPVTGVAAATQVYTKTFTTGSNCAPKPSFAANISSGFLALLALIFALFILI